MTLKFFSYPPKRYFDENGDVIGLVVHRPRLSLIDQTRTRTRGILLAETIIP